MQYFLILALLMAEVNLAAKGGGGAPPARVVTAPLERKVVSPVQSIVGSIRFLRVSKLALEEEGLVEWHTLEAGKRFSKGDLLLRLNTDQLQSRIRVLESRVKAQEAQLELRQTEVERQKRLLRGNASTREEYDRAHFAHLESQANLQAFQEELQLERLKLQKSELRAPADGILLEYNSEVGSWIGKGSPVATLAYTDEIVGEVGVSEHLIPFVRQTKKARVKVSAMDFDATARLHSIVPRGNTRSRTFMVRYGLPEDYEWMQNYTVEIEVPVASPARQTLIPRGAIIDSPKGGQRVYQVQDNQAVAVTIELQGFHGQQAILQGDSLKGVTAVIVDGNERLKAGQSVQVVQDL